MKTFLLLNISFAMLLLAAQVLSVSTVAAEEESVDAETVERLERLIKEQQRQLESLQQQLNQLKKAATDAQTEAEEAKSLADELEDRVNRVSTAKATDAQAPSGKVVTSGGGERMKLSINGFVNRAEASLLSKRFGKLSLGKGNVGAFGTASIDLSRTGLISYANIRDTAGGCYFGKKETSRSRMSGSVMPSMHLTVCCEKTGCATTRPHSMNSTSPARLSAISAMKGHCGGGRGQGYGFKAAAGTGITDPNEDDTGLQYGGSFSILHEDTGLNFTLEKYDTEAYLLYRLHSLDREVEPSVHDNGLVSIGTRVKF